MANILEKKPNHIELISKEDLQVKETYNRVFNNLHKNSSMLLNAFIQYVKMNNYENYGIFPNFLNDFELTSEDFFDIDGKKYVRLPYGLALFETNDLLNEISESNVIFYNYNDVILAQRQISEILDIPFETDTQFVKIKNNYNKFKMHIKKTIVGDQSIETKDYFYGCVDELEFEDESIEGDYSVILLNNFFNESDFSTFFNLNFIDKDITKIFLEEIKETTNLEIDEYYHWAIDRELNDFVVIHEDSLTDNYLKLNTFKGDGAELTNDGRKILSIEEHITNEVKGNNPSELSQILGSAENFHDDILSNTYALSDNEFTASQEEQEIEKQSVSIPIGIDRAIISFQNDIKDFGKLFNYNDSLDNNKSFFLVTQNIEESIRLCSNNVDELNPIDYSNIDIKKGIGYEELGEFLFGVYEDAEDYYSIVGPELNVPLYLKNAWIEKVSESESIIHFTFISTKSNFTENYDFIYNIVSYD